MNDTKTRTAGVLLVVLLPLGFFACNRSGGASAAAAAPEAVIRVEAGNGRLADGEEYVIAEWRSGAGAADFRGQDGGPTLDLSVTGLDGVGAFACGGEGATASLELRVDVTNAYRAVPDAPCTVEVTRAENGVTEGRYTATLRHAGNAADEMTVSGTFRATREDGAVTDIKAAKAPTIGKIR